MSEPSVDLGPLMKESENKPEIKARIANTKDIASLLFLEKRSSSEDMWSPEEFDQVFQDKKIRIVIVETFTTDKDNVRIPSPAAYLAFEARKKEVIIWSITVVPYLRRRGIARGLLGWLKEVSAAHLRSERLSCVLRESDLDAQLFFKGVDFRCNKTVSQAYECPPEDGLLFHHPLTPPTTPPKAKT